MQSLSMNKCLACQALYMDNINPLYGHGNDNVDTKDLSQVTTRPPPIITSTNIATIEPFLWLIPQCQLQ